MSKKKQRDQPPDQAESPSPETEPPFASDFLAALDEPPEFHDPFSELSLFLSQKIKREICHCSNPKKWSSELQDELLHKIAPEFRKFFPKYRLGVTALKKSWEKVQYVSSQIQSKREALTQNGKLNRSFFIKENLKLTTKYPQGCLVHPYYYAHQLAIKMSECIAVVDGIRPKLEELTRTIWSLQRHLLPKLSPEHFKNPYDETSKADSLIAKSILEISAKHGEISQIELNFYVNKKLEELRALTTDYTSSEIKKMLTALFADHCQFTTQRMENTLGKIPYSIAKCLKSTIATIAIDSPYFGPEQVVEEAFSLLEQSKEALTGVEGEQLEQKIHSWTIQGDMLIRFVRFREEAALATELGQNFDLDKTLEEIINSTLRDFLEKYPRLLSFAKETKQRAWIYLKHLFYQRGFEEKTPTYDRFIAWNKKLLEQDNLSEQDLLDQIERTCRKSLPLIPFNRARAEAIVIAKKQTNT